MNISTLILVILVTFLFGLATGILAAHISYSRHIDWLICDYEKQMDVARHTITRLDAIVSERSRRSNESKFSPIHCQPLPTNDIDWQELDFPNKGDKL